MQSLRALQIKLAQRHACNKQRTLGKGSKEFEDVICIVVSLRQMTLHRWQQHEAECASWALEGYEKQMKEKSAGGGRRARGKRRRRIALPHRNRGSAPEGGAMEGSGDGQGVRAMSMGRCICLLPGIMGAQVGGCNAKDRREEGTQRMQQRCENTQQKWVSRLRTAATRSHTASGMRASASQSAAAVRWCETHVCVCWAVCANSSSRADSPLTPPHMYRSSESDEGRRL